MNTKSCAACEDREKWAALARRALGLLSDVARLEGAIASVLNDYSALGGLAAARTEARLEPPLGMGARIRVRRMGPCMGRRGVIYDVTNDHAGPPDGRDLFAERLFKVQLDGDEAGAWWPVSALERE